MVLSQKRIPNLWKTNPAFYSNESEGQLGVPATVASLDLLHLNFQSSRRFLLETTILGGELLVSGRVYTNSTPSTPTTWIRFHQWHLLTMHLKQRRGRTRSSWSCDAAPRAVLKGEEALTNEGGLKNEMVGNNMDKLINYLW